MFTMAQNFGLPFFLATLVKNAKMLPVMVGGIVSAGERYAARKWFQVALIIGGCVLVTVGKKSSTKSTASASSEGGSTEMLGFLCLAVSLVGDGFTGGQQKAMSKSYAECHKGAKLKPYDLMTFTNLAMMAVALVASLATGQFFSGVQFLQANAELLPMVVKFSFCSAIGQSAIFFTMANFDPLVVTTVTTTRKIFSVLLGIVQEGKPLAQMQWAGVGVASLGVLGELQEKFGAQPKTKGR
jgi:UDP-galactose transporter B1